jgi:hypothetical protein
MAHSGDGDGITAELRNACPRALPKPGPKRRGLPGFPGFTVRACRSALRCRPARRSRRDLRNVVAGVRLRVPVNRVLVQHAQNLRHRGDSSPHQAAVALRLLPQTAPGQQSQCDYYPRMRPRAPPASPAARRSVRKEPVPAPALGAGSCGSTRWPGSARCGCAGDRVQQAGHRKLAPSNAGSWSGELAGCSAAGHPHMPRTERCQLFRLAYWPGALVIATQGSAWAIATVIRNSTQHLPGGQIVPVPGGPAHMQGREPRTGKEACAVWRRRWPAGPEHRARLLAEWF